MSWQAVLVAALKALFAGLWEYLEKRKLVEQVATMQDEKRDSAIEATEGFKDVTKAVLHEQATPIDDAAVLAARERLRSRAARANKGSS